VGGLGPGWLMRLALGISSERIGLFSRVWAVIASSCVAIRDICKWPQPASSLFCIHPAAAGILCRDDLSRNRSQLSN
jgi:hypothetical protein